MNGALIQRWTCLPPHDPRSGEDELISGEGVKMTPSLFRPLFRSPSPPSHHYDNNLGDAAVYSTIKPRAKRAATPTPRAAANEVDGERCASLGDDGFHLTSGEQGRGGRSEKGGAKTGRAKSSRPFVFQLKAPRQRIANMKFSPPPTYKQATSARRVTWVNPPVRAVLLPLSHICPHSSSVISSCPPLLITSPCHPNVFLSLLLQALTSASRSPEDPEICLLSGGNCRNQSRKGKPQISWTL